MISTERFANLKVVDIAHFDEVQMMAYRDWKLETTGVMIPEMTWNVSPGNLSAVLRISGDCPNRGYHWVSRLSLQFSESDLQYEKVSDIVSGLYYKSRDFIISKLYQRPSADYPDPFNDPIMKLFLLELSSYYLQISECFDKFRNQLWWVCSERAASQINYVGIQIVCSLDRVISGRASAIGAVYEILNFVASIQTDIFVGRVGSRIDVWSANPFGYGSNLRDVISQLILSRIP